MLLSAPDAAATIYHDVNDDAGRHWVDQEAEASQQGQCLLSSMFRAKCFHMDM